MRGVHELLKRGKPMNRFKNSRLSLANHVFNSIRRSTMASVRFFSSRGSSDYSFRFNMPQS